MLESVKKSSIVASAFVKVENLISELINSQDSSTKNIKEKKMYQFSLSRISSVTPDEFVFEVYKKKKEDEDDEDFGKEYWGDDETEAPQ